MCPSFPFGIEGRILDVTVLIPEHCLSIYFLYEDIQTIIFHHLMSTYLSFSNADNIEKIK